MEFWIWILVICATSMWVYWDATANKIGKIEGEGGLFNMSAGAWAAVTLGLWIVGFPAYLINRSRLIEKAKEHPQESIFKKGGIAILAFFALGLIYITTPGFAGAVPRCNSGDVVVLTERLIADIPAFQELDTSVSIHTHFEVSYDEAADVRRCSAFIRIGSDDERVFFEISWYNKMAGEIWVEFTE